MIAAVFRRGEGPEGCDLHLFPDYPAMRRYLFQRGWAGYSHRLDDVRVHEMEVRDGRDRHGAPDAGTLADLPAVQRGW